MKNIKKIISVLLAVCAFSSIANAEVNKYNEMDYVNNTNRTIGEIASEKNITVEEFLSMYNLPADMPANTIEAAAFYQMTVDNAAKMFGDETDALIQKIDSANLDGVEITKDTLWDVAYGSMLIKNHIGEYSFEEFKNAYRLGEDVTENSTLGEIRNHVAKVQMEILGVLTYFNVEDILVLADGKYLDFDVAPAIINDRTMVPMRNIFEYFNAEIAWDGETKTILAKVGDDIITMQVGQNFFFMNDVKIEIDSPSVIVNDRTLVPVRAISEALKREVAYNSNTRTVIIH